MRVRLFEINELNLSTEHPVLELEPGKVREVKEADGTLVLGIRQSMVEGEGDVVEVLLRTQVARAVNPDGSRPALAPGVGKFPLKLKATGTVRDPEPVREISPGGDAVGPEV